MTNLLAALALLSAARAYETDQLTGRDQPLLDSLPAANAYMDVALREVLAESQGARLCRMPTPELRRVLASRIRHRTAKHELLWSRGLTGMWGYGRYSLQLEEGALAAVDLGERGDIFGELPAKGSLILRYAGPASTIRLGEARLGTDKLHHFFSEGWKYYRRSGWGADPAAGKRWGTRTENEQFGLRTSKVFSYADLKANWDGYGFFAGLLEEGSLLQRGEDGCPIQVRPWDWSEWVTWEYDEVLNPSVFTPTVQRGVEARLAEDREAYCAAWARWSTPEQEAQIQESLSRIPDYVEGPSPPRTDPFRLAERCAEPAVSARSGG